MFIDQTRFDAFWRNPEKYCEGTFVQGEVFRKSLPGMQRTYFTAEDVPGLAPVIRYGLRTGREVESNARIAHFLWQLDKGVDPMEAALSVKKYLFDYQRGLTQFEQTVMRRIFPFYAWTRFNLPLQIEALVSNPRPFIRLADFINTIRSKGSPEFEEKSAAYRGEDAKWLSQFIKDQVGIPFRIGPNGEPEYFLLSSWLPAADIEALSKKGSVFSRLLDLLTPFLKTPAEQMTNRDLFYDRAIEEYAGETQRFLGIEMRRRYAHLLRNIRGLSEADRIMKQFRADPNASEEQLSALGTATRLLFGLKAYEAKPEVESRRMKREQKETRMHLRSAIRNDLPDAAEMLSDQLAGDESGSEE